MENLTKKMLVVKVKNLTMNELQILVQDFLCFMDSITNKMSNMIGPYSFKLHRHALSLDSIEKNIEQDYAASFHSQNFQIWNMRSIVFTVQIPFESNGNI